MEWRFWARTGPAHFDAIGDDCEAIEPLLSLYGDGMASPDEARLVEAHLPGCESCRESLAWMQATRRALTGRPVQSPPADLHARIAEAIAASDAAPLRLRPARTFVTRPAFAAAASLAAVGLFLGYSLTHLPRPVVAVNPVPPRIVAAVPVTPPVVPAAPEKHAPAAVKKFQPAPQVAAADPTDAVTGSTHFVQTGPPETAPLRRPSLNAIPPVPAPRLRVLPRFKPVMPHASMVAAQKLPAPVKRTPAPLPLKAPVAIARGDVRGTVKLPDVSVLSPKVIPQEPPPPAQTASVSAEPRVQTVDFVREVRAHLPSAEFSRTVGLSVRGVAKMTQTFSEEGKAHSITDIHSPNF